MDELPLVSQLADQEAAYLNLLDSFSGHLGVYAPGPGVRSSFRGMGLAPMLYIGPPPTAAPGE